MEKIYSIFNLFIGHNLLTFMKNDVSGSIEGGHYDGHYREVERRPFNYSRKISQENVTSYSETILTSTVSQSITYHLGDPVTQPSTMTQLRRDATVQCRFHDTTYNSNFVTCNVTECLFDIENDPCETRNIVEQYPRVRKRSTLNLIARVISQHLLNFILADVKGLN